MALENFELIEEDKNYLEKYCKEYPGSSYSKLIKAMILINDNYSQADIENTLSINLKYTRINSLIKIYNKFGLKKLLEGDVTNRYKIYFKMKENGWIELFFEFDGLTIKIKLSNVFDPIPDLLQFINDINNNKEIINVNVNEEGREKRIQLNRIHELIENLYELTVIADQYPYSEYKFIKVIHKDIFLYKFVEAFIELANENINAKWVSGYNFSELILNEIKDINHKLIEKRNI
ncbi:MAG: hypothetical protein LBI28_00550 [Treponema sp.]|jgi:hypothetical protein|nr:hypothetical protein [Treponema sp.]